MLFLNADFFDFKSLNVIVKKSAQSYALKDSVARYTQTRSGTQLLLFKETLYTIVITKQL